MSGYTLTWKNATRLPVVGAFIRPDTLGRMEVHHLKALRVRVGRVTHALSELFDVTGHAGDTLTLRNLPRLHHIGEGMSSGTLVIEGHVGDDLGASMAGGTIRVHGDAGHRIGGPANTSSRGMIGGEIIIDGNAGEEVGLRMRRGLIYIAGKCGLAPGNRMIAGTIVIAHGPLHDAGLEMKRGTILCLEGAHGAMPHMHSMVGEFEVGEMASLRLVLARLKSLGVQINPAKLSARCVITRGDRFELNRGEVVQWVS